MCTLKSTYINADDEMYIFKNNLMLNTKTDCIICIEGKRSVSVILIKRITKYEYFDTYKKMSPK